MNSKLSHALISAVARLVQLAVLVIGVVAAIAANESYDHYRTARIRAELIENHCATSDGKTVISAKCLYPNPYKKGTGNMFATLGIGMAVLLPIMGFGRKLRSVILRAGGVQQGVQRDGP